MPGIWTASSTTATYSASRARRASSPDSAVTSRASSGSSTAVRASRVSGRSSTSRTLGRSGTAGGRVMIPASLQPHPHERQELVHVHRLGDVVGGPRGDALLAVALHRLRRERDDRQVLEAARRPDRARRLVAVHL